MVIQEVLCFAAGVIVGGALIAVVLGPIISQDRKFLAYRNPADMLFYEFEMARLAKDHKKTFKLPLPFLSKKKPEPAVPAPAGPTSDLEETKRRMEVGVEAMVASRDYDKRRREQAEQFLKSRQGGIV